MSKDKARRSWTPRRVKRLRERLEMTQASFAQAINYSAKSTISLWERGLRPVTPRAYPALDRIEKGG